MAGGSLRRRASQPATMKVRNGKGGGRGFVAVNGCWTKKRRQQKRSWPLCILIPSMLIGHTKNTCIFCSEAMMCQWVTRTHLEGAQTQELGEIKTVYLWIWCVAQNTSFSSVAHWSQITLNCPFGYSKLSHY